ncbi:hypothetical protein [Kocuria rhizophila]|uniref:hypothetical protein n=2 Tax=Kocuria rhizophila TaxID=72000 RepID=UPI0002EBBEF0|nr:hypothetical protein [Kocuria rhizophila]
MSTPHNEPPAPKKRWAPKKIAKIGCLGLIGLFILLVVLGLIGAAMTGTLGQTPPKETPSSSASTSPSETTTTEPTATPTAEATTPVAKPSTEAPKPTSSPTTEPTRAPAKTQAPKDPLADVTAPVDGAKAHMEGPVLFVQIPLQEGFTGPSTSVAQKDTVDVLKAVQESGVDYTRVFVQGDPEKGGLGTLNAGYDKATVDSIDFSTVVVPEIWNARDAGNVSAELQ